MAAAGLGPGDEAVRISAQSGLFAVPEPKHFLLLPAPTLKSHLNVGLSLPLCCCWPTFVQASLRGLKALKVKMTFNISWDTYSKTLTGHLSKSTNKSILTLVLKWILPSFPAIKQKYAIWRWAVKDGFYKEIDQEDTGNVALLSPCGCPMGQSQRSHSGRGLGSTDTPRALGWNSRFLSIWMWKRLIYLHL